MTLICLNVLAVILETVKSIESEYARGLWVFELASVMIFSVEYLLRLWTCTSNKHFQHSVIGRVKFIFTPFAIIDLLAVLPFYLPALVGFDLRFIRVLRLMRIFRIFKLGRYSRSLRVLIGMVKAKKEDFLITVFLASLFIIFTSSLLYFVELHYQTQVFPNIPSAIWWGLSRVAGVGAQGVSPQASAGKILGLGLVLLGRVGFFAVPAAILASGFLAEMQRRREE